MTRGVRTRIAAVVAGIAVVAAACSSGDDSASEPSATTGQASATSATAFSASTTDLPPPPPVPDGPLAPEVVDALDVVVDPLNRTLVDGADAGGRLRIASVLPQVAASGDVRVAWILVDLLSFEQGTELDGPLTDTLDNLVGFTPEEPVAWVAFHEVLSSWDIPAPPDYLDYKTPIYVGSDARWEPFFVAETSLDWRQVSWGGVFFDGIPTVTDPDVLDGDDGSAAWSDDTLVFGVELAGEARAYPRAVLEQFEVVNDRLGGRDIVVPFCTLCLSAVPYATDDAARVIGGERLELFTSGLLNQSNKLMYDELTFSLWSEFTGEAVTGELWEAALELEPLTVVSSTWGAWKADYPDTTIIAAPEGFDPDQELFEQTRDAAGPIFPVADVDPRLGAQTEVFGVAPEGGQPVAFAAKQAKAALEGGERITVDAGGVSVELRLEGGGLAAFDDADDRLDGRQAFWFAWSQFNPDTLLWTAEAGLQ